MTCRFDGECNRKREDLKPGQHRRSTKAAGSARRTFWERRRPRRLRTECRRGRRRSQATCRVGTAHRSPLVVGSSHPTRDGNRYSRTPDSGGVSHAGRSRRRGKSQVQLSPASSGACLLTQSRRQAAHRANKAPLYNRCRESVLAGLHCVHCEAIAVIDAFFPPSLAVLPPCRQLAQRHVQHLIDILDEVELRASASLPRECRADPFHCAWGRSLP